MAAQTLTVREATGVGVADPLGKYTDHSACVYHVVNERALLQIAPSLDHLGCRTERRTVEHGWGFVGTPR